MNINHLRQDTPGTRYHRHLNNAGAALPPKPVIQAVQNYLQEEALHGGYETAAKHAAGINRFYGAAAKLLNAKAHNIAFAGHATEAFNKALSSIPFQPGDVLLTTDDDYTSNQIAFLFLQKHFKIKLLRAGKLPEGGVDVGSMKKLIEKHRPKLVAVTHVPTNSGLVQDVEGVGALCQKHGIWYLVDACQSAGQILLDVARIGCDFLSLTMRKWLRGPRGAGFLFVSDRALRAGLEPVFPDLGGAEWTEPGIYKNADDASRFAYWEKNYALLLGSKAAIEYALGLGLENIEKRVAELAGYARQQLNALPGWKVLDLGKKKCGIVTAHHESSKPAIFKAALKKANINAGFASTANALIDFTEKKVTWAMRVSPHYYNTKEEIDGLVAALKG
ncbi:MAG TPA: aminotransferase class V-fold PLP-dependent enzyme [Bacteroidetes bacterium]|nr:aminotransferase class V-fold PLP-dependent enzyme [Bacteroidota bacterium]